MRNAMDVRDKRGTNTKERLMLAPSVFPPRSRDYSMLDNLWCGLIMVGQGPAILFQRAVNWIPLSLCLLVYLSIISSIYGRQLDMTRVLLTRMDGLRLYALFNGISAISGRWEDEHERFCVMKRRISSKRIHLQRETNERPIKGA